MRAFPVRTPVSRRSVLAATGIPGLIHVDWDTLREFFSIEAVAHFEFFYIAHAVNLYVNLYNSIGVI